MEDSRVAEWYAYQKILVTGATGFMGKVLIEKLLRSCGKVDTIYLVVRNKKGKNCQQRLQDILNSAIFDTIKSYPNSEELFKKLHVIHGDVLNANLNLKNEDLELLQKNVTMVFHMAANVKFDQELKEAVLNNVGGTKNMLELALNFKNLKSFVHVSTSYCHCDETVLEERLYDTPDNPSKILDLVNWLNPDVLDKMTPHLLRNSPNTYAYTKALTEQLVNKYSDKLPIAIGRPSIVTSILKEPIPGWVDGLNGPTGIFVGAGKGVIRSMHCNKELFADIVPADVTINSIILIGWKRAMEEKKETDFYNIVANKEVLISWDECVEIGKKHLMKNPFSLCLWYPGGSFKSNYFLHWLCVLFFHTVPAYVVDFLMIITRNKPFLLNAQKRISNGLKVLQYYTTRAWVFHDEKLKKIYKDLNDTDRKIFYTNAMPIDYDKYLLDYVLGARKYCCKEDPSTLPQARKNLKRLYYLDLFVNCVLMGMFLWFLYSMFSFLETPIHAYISNNPVLKTITLK